MICKKQYIVLLKIRGNGVRHLVCRRRTVRCYGDRAYRRNGFYHRVSVKRNVRYGVSRGCRRMSMEHRSYVVAFFIAAKMHFDFRRRSVTVNSLKHLALGIYYDEFFGSYKAFADTCRRCKEVAVGQFYREVTVICRNPAELPHLMANIAHNFSCFHIIHFSSSFRYLIRQRPFGALYWHKEPFRL